LAGLFAGGNTLFAALDAAQCDASAAGRVAASDPAMRVALVELEDYFGVDYCVTSRDPDRRATVAKKKWLEEVREGPYLFADNLVT
jgi:hypothetical protein